MKAKFLQVLTWSRDVNPRLIHVNVWQKPLQYCKAISLQLIKINVGKKVNVEKKNKKAFWSCFSVFQVLLESRLLVAFGNFL